MILDLHSSLDDSIFNSTKNTSVIGLFCFVFTNVAPLSPQQGELLSLPNTICGLDTLGARHKY